MWKKDLEKLELDIAREKDREVAERRGGVKKRIGAGVYGTGKTNKWAQPPRVRQRRDGAT